MSKTNYESLDNMFTIQGVSIFDQYDQDEQVQQARPTITSDDLQESICNSINAMHDNAAFCFTTNDVVSFLLDILTVLLIMALIAAIVAVCVLMPHAAPAGGAACGTFIGVM